MSVSGAANMEFRNLLSNTVSDLQPIYKILKTKKTKM